MKMEEKTNCLNCGATLHYDETQYGSTAKCKFCGTEYHIDKLGRVEEYKVKLKMQNHIISFYIGSMIYEPAPMETYRTIDGDMHCAPVCSCPNITLELHSYDIEDIEEGEDNESKKSN
jgi:DNA-directed RNA polymerase subunit M/transcription elongation factor TFIIS